jgi:hypothetical protein
MIGLKKTTHDKWGSSLEGGATEAGHEKIEAEAGLRALLLIVEVLEEL